MVKIKKFIQFLEDANSTASSTAGMGGVSNAQPGALAGTTGTEGSGDISFYMLDKKGKKIKKGNPSEVSDMRYLEPTKGVTKLKESYRLTDEENDIIYDSIQELLDDGFGLTMLQHEKERQWFDAEEGERDYFDYEEILIGIHKSVETHWVGNISIRCKFDKREIIDKRIATMRGTPINEKESKLVDDVENVVFQLINQLNYDEGSFTVSFDVAGSAMPLNSPRMVSNNINIVLYKKIKNQKWKD